MWALGLVRCRLCPPPPCLQELGNLEEDYLSQQEVNSILTAVVQVRRATELGSRTDAFVVSLLVWAR